MKVDLLGTSCTWFTRNNTSYIIDDKILLDISAGNYKEVIKRINVDDIKSVFITHWHHDHIGDLSILTTDYLRRKLKNPDLPKLKLYSKSGMAEYIIAYNKMKLAKGDEIDIELLKNSVEFIDIKDGDEFEDNGYKVKVYKVDHNDMDCVGFTFTGSTGKTVAFSGDTKLCDNLEKMLSVSDFGLVDMASPTPNINHLDYEEFVRLSKKYPDCKMYPIHTSDASQKLAEENNLNAVHDGDILYF